MLETVKLQCPSGTGCRQAHTLAVKPPPPFPLPTLMRSKREGMYGLGGGRCIPQNPWPSLPPRAAPSPPHAASQSASHSAGSGPALCAVPYQGSFRGQSVGTCRAGGDDAGGEPDATVGAEGCKPDLINILSSIDTSRHELYSQLYPP